MTTTAQTLIDESRRHLFSGTEEEANRLNGAITNSATAIPFKYTLGGIAKGAIVAIDLEEIRVWETSGQLASVVERGVNGTTAAAHSNLAYVAVRPRFSNFRILTALNEDLADLCSPVNGLFQVKTVDLTYNASVQGYNLTNVTDLINPLQVRYKTTGPARNWPMISDYSLLRAMATLEFASTLALVVYQSAYPGLPIHLRYSADFAPLVNTTDDVQAVSGLPASANDLPPIGAAIRLVAPREVQRNFVDPQKDPKWLDAVPPGAVANSIRDLSALRQSRIIAEAARLQSDWPLLVNA